MISKTYLLLSNDPVNNSDPSGLKIKQSKAGRKWTKTAELGTLAYAKSKKLVLVNNKNKITYIRLHHSGIKKDKYINFGYGHTIRIDSLYEIHANDMQIHNNYVEGTGVTYQNVESRPAIWVNVKKCDQQLYKDFKYIVKKINKDIPKLSLTQNQADALIDLRYHKGHLPKSVIAACKSNNRTRIRKAISSVTEGVDPNRIKRIVKRFKKK
jgi:GH24 family phage-related lysozyme (muramidase)